MLSSPRSIPVALPVGPLDPARPRAAPPQRHFEHFILTLPTRIALQSQPSTSRTPLATLAAHRTRAFGAESPGSVAAERAVLDESHLPQLPPAHDVDGDDEMHREKHTWIEHAPFDHFELDSATGSQVDEPALLLLNHPRSNSLELDLGDLPKPNFLFPSQAYPSPVSPCTTLFSSSTSSYFDLDQRRGPRARCASDASGEGDEMSLALPPSPALVPISLVVPAPTRDASPSRPAPHVEPSVSHPLHRAKRLSMTPLPTLSSLPSADAPPKLRKSSIVDLPPASPPLTPESSLGLVGLPSIEVFECGRRLSSDSNADTVDAHKRQRCA
ncbi:hypothetical protein Rt10032_c06g2861 [Rhodotorula toruloides]|uniref:Uncharacterized protein n=1 Tax=Rhodotorula toruloides TaxID=5286 RepID=A0A511KHA3_RHOTO|nr:hypothetical protein Rt10032_c06g2861 [Rhodotorula toruloides]